METLQEILPKLLWWRGEREKETMVPVKPKRQLQAIYPFYCFMEIMY